MGRHVCLAAVCAALLGAVAVPDARAQSSTGDAREVALGGVDYAGRILADSSGPPSPGFVVPLGLLQLLKDRDALRIGSDRFDPSLVLEYSAVPTHWVIGRRPSLPRARFIDDIRGAHLSPDLNVYRGFKPAATLDGGGRLSPAVGKTFTVRRTPRVTHQAFAGAGPYLTIQTQGLFDERLVGLLGASSPGYLPDAALRIGNQSTGQAAAQFTGGYRAQLAVGPPGGNSHIEFFADYNYLRGFRYEDVDIDLRIATDARGLVAFDSPDASRLAIDRITSTSGSGLSVDLAVTAVFDRWRVAVRADGVGNHLDWRKAWQREYEMAQLGGGSDSLRTIAAGGAGDVRVTVPVELRLQGAYRDQSWGAVVELEDGFQGATGSAGLERRFASLELRGGARLVHEVVLPSAGVSLRAGPVWIDIGAAVTMANLEQQRNIIAATSLRFGFGGAKPVATEAQAAKP